MDDTNGQTGDAAATEINSLKQRARMMNITFSNNIGLEALRAKVNEKLGQDAKDSENPLTMGQDDKQSQDEKEELDANENDEINGFEAAAAIAAQKDFTPAQTYKPQLDHDKAAAVAAAPAKPKSLRQRIYDEQMKLVRIRITNMNPSKADLPGEFFTVANEYLGTVKKFVPFGEVTDDGFHVPYCIYRQMEERKFTSIRTSKDKRTGAPKVEYRDAKEFALEVLPPLTSEEIAQLAVAQIAAGSID